MNLTDSDAGMERFSAFCPSPVKGGSCSLGFVMTWAPLSWQWLRPGGAVPPGNDGNSTCTTLAYTEASFCQTQTCGSEGPQEVWVAWWSSSDLCYYSSKAMWWSLHGQPSNSGGSLPVMLGGGFHRCQAASRWLKGAGSTSCFFTILGPFFFPDILAICWDLSRNMLKKYRKYRQYFCWTFWGPNDHIVNFRNIQ